LIELLPTRDKGDKGHGGPASPQMHFSNLKVVTLPSINLPIEIPVNSLLG